MAAKKSRRKSLKKSTKRAAKPKRASWAAIVDPKAKLSPYAKKAQRVFSAGVQDAYANMARLGVRATVIVDGKVIRAVPTRSAGRFVVREPSPSRSRDR
jgi:hypothetical protein